MRDDALRLELLYLFDELGDDEQEVLTDVARRLYNARDTYGELDIDSDRRDFDEEADEEMLDLFAYKSMQRIRKRRRGD